MKPLDPRRKVFGGGAGIFLRKRRLQTAAKEPSAKRRAVTPSPTEELLIGWDDVKCRPIFNRQKVAPLVEVSDVEHRRGGNSKQQQQTPTIKWNKDPGRKKPKAYGGHKRPNFFPENTSSNNRKPTPSTSTINKAPAKSPLLVIKRKDTHTLNVFPLNSPAPVSDSICNTLNSVQRHVPGKNKSEVVERKNINKTKDEGKRRRLQFKTTGLAQFDFVDCTGAKQPTSGTSLTAAKAFFERLDSTESLLVDSSKTPEHASRKCGRTLKRVDLNDRGLQREYEEYSKVSAECDVSPMSLTEYAKNRSTLFRRTEMFDGFLDV